MERLVVGVLEGERRSLQSQECMDGVSVDTELDGTLNTDRLR